MKNNNQSNSFDENSVRSGGLPPDMLERYANLFLKTSQKQYLDSADVKQLLNISDSTLYRLRKKKIIPAIRLGGKLYCPRSFFTEIMNEGRPYHPH